MSFRTMPLALRGALTLCGAVLLAACDPGRATSPEAVVGSWLSAQLVSGSSSLHSEQRVDLRADGTYAWFVRISGPAGRPEDGLIETFEHSGSWKIAGGQLGLHTLSGMGWRHGQGGYQADYAGEWNYQHRLKVEGVRMELHYVTRPEQSIAPYTLVFERVADTPPGPQAHRR